MGHLGKIIIFSSSSNFWPYMGHLSKKINFYVAYPVLSKINFLIIILVLIKF